MQDETQPASFGIRSTKKESAQKGTEATYEGIGGSRGITIGECYVFIKEESSHEVRELNDKNISEEIERFLTALNRSEHELQKIEHITSENLEKATPIFFRPRL